MTGIIPNLSTTQRITKAVVETPEGIVASQHSRASRAGAEVLAAGGNAVDAAIATGFALGVVEPWMSGPGGGGGAVFWNATEGKAYALNFGMRSPAGLDVADYPLTGAGRANDLFPWPAVKDDRNVNGATAVAVPGMVAGMGEAHARFATMPWADLLAPATALANEGMLIDWYTSLLIAGSAPKLASVDADTAATFLTDGRWPPVSGWTSTTSPRIPMTGMADTLGRLAHAGPGDFYTGDIAAAVAQDVQGKGGSLSVDDLAAYSAAWVEPYAFDRAGVRFRALPGLTAGPTFGDIFDRLAESDSKGPLDPARWEALARALDAAYTHRLATMGHDGEAPERPACTSHFSIVDRHGNMVAWTQTLLSIFGSCVTSQSTGMLMNNGIMWFDPEQGKPNSLQPGKPCLMNICPVIGLTGDGGFALGASGGRKIVGAVSQLSHMIADRGMSLEEAFHAPRIDLASGSVIADDAIPAEGLEALSKVAEVTTTKRTIYPFHWAFPSGVMRRGGLNTGCTEVTAPWGDALSEGHVAKSA